MSGGDEILRSNLQRNNCLFRHELLLFHPQIDSECNGLCGISGGVYILFLFQVAGMIITYELVLLQINEDSGDSENVLCNTIIA